jgi:hypothetical protein
VQWRYAFISTNLQFPNKFPPLNEEWPWYKSWVDEYYTIYPDGVVVRKVNDYSGASVYWQDVQFLAPPGETAEDQVELKAITLANVRFWSTVKSDSLVLDWTNGTPTNTLENANMELINFKSQYKPFLIFPEGTFISPWGGKGKYSHFMTWNHWPTAQIPSDGRNALFTDRVTHSALAAADNAVFHGNRAIYGFTDKSATSLMPLSLSWNYPPQIRNTKECNSNGYDPDQRSFLLESNSSKLSFDLVGSKISPIYNPCFLIKGWDEKGKAGIEIDGITIPEGKDFRQGIIYDTEGKRTLVVWIKIVSEKKKLFSIYTAN